MDRGTTVLAVKMAVVVDHAWRSAVWNNPDRSRCHGGSGSLGLPVFA